MIMRHNEIFGLDVDKFTSEEIVEKVGVSKFSNEQLLDGLLEAVQEIGYAIQYEDHPRHQEAGLMYAPTVYEIYKRFYRDKKELQVITNIGRSIKNTPDTIQFWIRPFSITALFEIMVEDGYYKLKSSEESLAMEDNHAKT
jgi:hypothetical protein